MSGTSVRRLRERSNAGGKIAASNSIPSKTLTPLIEKNPSIGSAKNPCTGKENPISRSSSRAFGSAQKPAVNPIPRMSSTSSGNVESRSKPRGRSPSPFDFNRTSSYDLRKTRVSGSDTSDRNERSVSTGRGSNAGIKVLDKKGASSFRVRKENTIAGDKYKDSGEKSAGESKSGHKRSNVQSRKDDTVPKSSAQSNVGSVHCAKEHEVENLNPVDKFAGESMNEDVVLKPNDTLDGGNSGHSGNKHASKLHEKLAYLEGKVKRIASDIKRTKEMLDMNNDDTSKVILSDIQKKISGIEKAVGNVIADSVMLGNDQDNIAQRTTNHIDQTVQANSAQVSAKGLSSEELEARLFPHQKLLKDRISLKVSSSSWENSSCPFDANQNAAVFSVSHSKVQAEVLRDVDDEIQETQDTGTSIMRQNLGIFSGQQSTELDLQADERLDEFHDQENKPPMGVEEDMEEDTISQLMEIGNKTCTGGWFVSEGESVLLAHNDGSCSFYDIANSEVKAEYRPPVGISEDIWRDCWIIRAPSAEGCSGKYVVASSAGNNIESGFCSWDFYSREVQAFHIEDSSIIKSNTRVTLGPLPDDVLCRRMPNESQQWWYRPCGPLIISTASWQKAVRVFDIRDGEHVMKWDVQKPVLAMDYSSPLQWRNRGKVVVAEAEVISLWDVNSIHSRALLSVSTSGHRISALHVNNSDAELGGGVRQRVSSSEAEGNDGVFCTSDSVNILDFRQPSGIGLKIPRIGLNAQSVSSKGDSIFLGCNSVSSSTKKQGTSQVLQFSLRKQRIVNTYSLPESGAHSHHNALTQVWGNSNLVMAVCGLGLFVFDALRDEGLPSSAIDCGYPQKFKEVIGQDDLYSPSFDYASSQILLVSRDRPAAWRHFSHV